MIITHKKGNKQISGLVHVLTIFSKSGNFISTCTNDDLENLYYVEEKQLNRFFEKLNLRSLGGCKRTPNIGFVLFVLFLGWK